MRIPYSDKPFPAVFARVWKVLCVAVRHVSTQQKCSMAPNFTSTAVSSLCMVYNYVLLLLLLHFLVEWSLEINENPGLLRGGCHTYLRETHRIMLVEACMVPWRDARRMRKAKTRRGREERNLLNEVCATEENWSLNFHLYVHQYHLYVSLWIYIVVEIERKEFTLFPF